MTRGSGAAAAHHGGSVRLATLFLTSDCNMDCAYCYARENTFGPDEVWDLPSLRRAMDLLAARGYRLSIGGGEPLTEPDLVLTTAREAARRGMDVSLLTNGFLLDETLLRACFQNGIRWIQISADRSADVDRMAPLLAAGRGLGVRMAVGTVLLPGRADEIRPMHDAIAAAGAVGWRILRYTPLQETTAADPSPTNGEWIMLLLEMEAALGRVESPLQIRYEPSVVPRSWAMARPPGQGLDVCGGRTGRRLFLYPDGAVYACGLPRRGGLRVGTLRDGREKLARRLDTLPFRTGWSGPDRRTEDAVSDPYCQEVCRGGCLQMRSGRSCDPRCQRGIGLVPLCCFEKLLLAPGSHAPGRPVPPSAVYREFRREARP